ncbi:hypothetical protein NQD34_011625 [Periophthalmus magnuspinnatus]|nr:hypothetical protein NQD34_011625 [Periophthalmus magnuspinnatus]
MSTERTHRERTSAHRHMSTERTHRERTSAQRHMSTPRVRETRSTLLTLTVMKTGVLQSALQLLRWRQMQMETTTTKSRSEPKALLHQTQVYPPNTNLHQRPEPLWTMGTCQEQLKELQGRNTSALFVKRDLAYK